MAGAIGLSELTYGTTPSALIKLRKAFDESGFDTPARQLTYAIKHTQTKQLLEGTDDARPSLIPQLSGLLSLYLVGLAVLCLFGRPFG
jgi:hypothetical protein